MPSTTMTTTGRSLEEMKASIRMRMQNMVNSALEIGMDLMETKEACKHGEWLPFLKDVGLSASTAANYMRIAREVSADSRMASLPYTKILALLSAPEEERESLAEAADTMSAAEIRRLTEERNRAAEAANAETDRADRAEEEAKRFYQEAAELRVRVQRAEIQLFDEKQKREVTERDLESIRGSLDEKEEEFQRMLRQCDEEARDEEREKLQDEIDDLRAKLLEAENNVVEVEVEKAPADYERLKQELIDAAADAEKRAADAEAELEALRSGQADEPDAAWKVLKVAMTRFMADCEMMPLDPQSLIRDEAKIKAYVSRLERWADSMRIAMAGTVAAEAVVV